MRKMSQYIKCDLPPGRSGDWSIEKFSVQSPKHGDDRIDCFKSRAGIYTRLKRGNEVFMTDLYDEWWTQRSAISQAEKRGGDVLITGLGLGLVIDSILTPSTGRIARVVVIERSADVISLVAPLLEQRHRDQIEIINADAFEWLPQPAQRFSVAWHDIWPNPHETGVMEQTKRLEHHYAPYCAWQGSWVRDYRATEQAGKIANVG